jgi:hypothetical protein
MKHRALAFQAEILHSLRSFRMTEYEDDVIRLEEYTSCEVEPKDLTLSVLSSCSKGILRVNAVESQPVLSYCSKSTLRVSAAKYLVRSV